MVKGVANCGKEARRTTQRNADADRRTNGRGSRRFEGVSEVPLGIYISDPSSSSVAASWVVEAVETTGTTTSTTTTSTTTTSITAGAVDVEAAVDARTRGRAMVAVVVVAVDAVDAVVRRGFDEKISCKRISSTSDRSGG
jgi:hypothetical protein